MLATLPDCAGYLIGFKKNLRLIGKIAKTLSPAFLAMIPFKSEDAKLIAKLGISYAAEDLLCIRDMTGRILVVNKAWERMLDYSLEEIENRPLIQLVHPDDRDATRRTMMLVNDDHRASLFQNRYRARNGEYKSLEWRAVRASSLVVGVARVVVSGGAAA